MTLQVTQVSTKTVVISKQSLKEHPQKQIDQIAASIEAFGFNDPIAIDEKNEIIEGTGRVLAARQLKLELIPAIRLAHLSEAQKIAYQIAHNKICLNTGFNLEVLSETFQTLCELDTSLLSHTGFEQAEMDDLLKRLELPDLAPELTEFLAQSKSVTCPKCGEVFCV